MNTTEPKKPKMQSCAHDPNQHIYESRLYLPYENNKPCLKLSFSIEDFRYVMFWKNKIGKIIRELETKFKLYDECIQIMKKCVQIIKKFRELKFKFEEKKDNELWLDGKWDRRYMENKLKVYLILNNFIKYFFQFFIPP